MDAAARDGRADLIAALGASGVDPDQPNNDGWKPIYVAIQHGHADCVAALHSAGADVNRSSQKGWTPTFLAAQLGRVDCIRALHAAGADVKRADCSGVTPLLAAVQNGHADCIAALHEAVADVRAGPTGECNALDSSSLSTLIISTVLSAVSLVYMTVSAGTSRGAFQIEASEESADEAEANAFAFFHVQMTMGSCYLAMLISNWTILGSSSMATMSSDQYKGPMGAKLASEFVCIALYIWSLVAPMLFPDRDFS